MLNLNVDGILVDMFVLLWANRAAISALSSAILARRSAMDGEVWRMLPPPELTVGEFDEGGVSSTPEDGGV